MTSIIRTKRPHVAWLMLVIFLANNLYPVTSYALTAGPTQPEVQGFTPAGTTDMVDTFSGDFNYNIPLFELPGPNGGYPFNLSYQAGITQDQEASWVGLGWSLNPGAINRQMRGLPDEFNGKDVITTRTSIDPNVTVGVGGGTGLEIFGGASDVGNIGFSIFYNNYKGFGYSLDAFATSVRNGMTSGVNGHLSLNSADGATANASISLGTRLGEFGLGAGFNSMRGLEHVTMTQNFAVDAYKTKTMKGSEKITKGFSSSVSSSISIASRGYTPQLSLPFNNISVSARLNVGGAFWGGFKKGYLTGYYTEQSLKDNNHDVMSHAYGYLHYDKQTDQAENAVFDFNREKDGIVSIETPNLAMPSMTYDIYSVTGQGISAMYRPMRNDIGILHDPEVVSETTGGSVGVDVAPELSHVGVNLTLNHSKSTSGQWTEDNKIAGVAKFQSQGVNDDFEPWYFKVHGEQTSSYTKNTIADKALRLTIDRPSDVLSEPGASTTLQSFGSGAAGLKRPKDNKTPREPRSEVIQTFTNEQVAKQLASGDEYISVFKNDGVDRSSTRYVPHHTAGFIATTSDGLRYNYTIPVYNTSQEEVTASTAPSTSPKVSVTEDSGTGFPTHTSGDKFMKKVTLPPYAHAYLLTSIIGPDYVDMGEEGVDEDDLGYWVKFTYQKASADYKWRDPFSQAHFIEGWASDGRDNKGSFTYGTKEIYYLHQAETKSHIAVFDTEDRLDGREAAGLFSNANGIGSGPKSQRLKQVTLYSRAGFLQTYPIKKVVFDYRYALCQGTPNSELHTPDSDPSKVNANKGKLTLKKLWFLYGNSNRGSLNPYEFDYYENEATHKYNPNYDANAYDRWGVYKPVPTDLPVDDPRKDMYNVDFPYSDQDPAHKDDIDLHAAAWSLREITTPSGSKIIVDYETDEYAYVQHKQATQMFQIMNSTTPYSLSGSNLEIQFKLEDQTITGTPTGPEKIAIVKKYVDPGQPLFFKALMSLHKPSETNFQEYIQGYVTVDDDENTMTIVQSGGTWYGKFKLANTEAPGIHPFSLRAWQHLRTNQPELARTRPEISPTTDNKARFNLIRSLSNSVGDVRTMLQGFNTYCATSHFGEEITPRRSWVRLKSSDKIKYGGGLRVKQITINDNWEHDKEGIYGQAYDYTLPDGSSSGVAANEPMIGGEENALRVPKLFKESVWLRSDNNLYFDYPINESYYPAPNIGYSKVTVTSLASASLAGNSPDHLDLNDTKGSVFPAGGKYGTTGKTVYEYHTAKDFPVITDETDKDDVPFNVNIGVPFLGNLSIHKLTSSQGYSIVTNDMHGKLYRTSNYRQGVDGSYEQDPMSSVTYNYAVDKLRYQGENVMEVRGDFEINQDKNTLSLVGEGDCANRTTSPCNGYSIGKESEFFIDMRQFEDNAWEGGANVNADLVIIPFLGAAIPVPTVWPSIGKSTTRLRTAVTNHIVFRPGILKSVEAYDGGSIIKTENLRWDKVTGQVVLSTATNNFDQLVYSYNVPAHTEYEGLSGAYKNVGLKVKIGFVSTTDNGYEFHTQIPDGLLYPGDEMLVYGPNTDPARDDLNNPIARVVYMDQYAGVRRITCTKGTLDEGTHYTGLIVRSGYRNQLNVTAGTITALKDPTQSGTPATHTRKVTVSSNQ